MNANAQFGLRVAQACVLSAQAAYGSEPPAIHTPLVHAIVSPLEGGGTILAFRGTQEPRDFITDAQCWMDYLVESQDWVHHGFATAFRSMRDELLDFVISKPAEPIFVTGHSLGGALAMLAANYLRHNLRVGAVYTFGGPRVGDATWAMCYDAALGDRTFRFVNEEDIVPRVPGMLAGYRHAGQEVFLPALGPMRFAPSLWFKVISDAIGLYKEWKQGRLALLADHHVSRYAQRIAVEAGRIRPQRNAEIARDGRDQRDGKEATA